MRCEVKMHFPKALVQGEFAKGDRDRVPGEDKDDAMARYDRGRAGMGWAIPGMLSPSKPNPWPPSRLWPKSTTIAGWPSRHWATPMSLRPTRRKHSNSVRWSINGLNRTSPGSTRNRLA
jgi:hypothetical protein